MSYNPLNPNGQASSANSAPVVIASDQSAVPVSSSTLATASNQTNASQKTQIVDGSGNVIGSSSNSLNVNITSGAGTLGSVKITDGTNTASVMSPGTANSTGNVVLIGSSTWQQTFSFTSITTSSAYDVGNYRTVSVQVNTMYTGSTPTLTFQTSNDNTNWVSQSLVGSNATLNTATPTTTTSGVIYEGTIRGRYFRLSQTGAYTSGTTAGVISFSTGPSSPIAMGVSATQNGIWTVAGTEQLTTGTITTSSSSIVSANANGYGGFTVVSIAGTYAGVSFGITQSNDAGTTFYNVPIYDSAANQWLAPGTTITPGTNASKLYWIPQYPGSSEIKVLASAYTSGTANVRIEQAQSSLPGSSMAQLMDAAGNNRGANVDANGNLDTTLGTLIAGENLTTNRLNTEPIYSYANITTATTTTVKSGSGTLHAITFNTLVASATVTVYDSISASGTKIGTFTLPSTITGVNSFTVTPDVSYATGLTIVTSGATDLTVSYR